MDFNPLLKEIIASGSPDLHLQVGQHPVARLRSGDVAAIEQYPVLTKEDIEE